MSERRVDCVVCDFVTSAGGGEKGEDAFGAIGNAFGVIEEREL